MRPRSFNRGNVIAGMELGKGFLASMRPRSFNRGNEAHYATFPEEIPGFNEAAVFQPRKQLQMAQLGFDNIELQ